MVVQVTANFTSPIQTERMTVIYAFQPSPEAVANEAAIHLEARARLMAVTMGIATTGFALEGFTVSW